MGHTGVAMRLVVGHSSHTLFWGVEAQTRLKINGLQSGILVVRNICAEYFAEVIHCVNNWQLHIKWLTWQLYHIYFPTKWMKIRWGKYPEIQLLYFLLKNDGHSWHQYNQVSTWGLTKQHFYRCLHKLQTAFQRNLRGKNIFRCLQTHYSVPSTLEKRSSNRCNGYSREV